MFMCRGSGRAPQLILTLADGEGYLLQQCLNGNLSTVFEQIIALIGQITIDNIKSNFNSYSKKKTSTSKDILLTFSLLAKCFANNASHSDSSSTSSQEDPPLRLGKNTSLFSSYRMYICLSLTDVHRRLH